MERDTVKPKAIPFAPARARPAIQHTLRILPQDCDNEAVVHNKEKLFENHNPDSIT